MSNLANKDAAMTCKDAGKAALAKGDFERAIRMFEKSMRLYPVPGVPEMKQRAEAGLKASKEKTSAPRRASSARGAASPGSSGGGGGGGGGGGEANGSSKAYTPAQNEIAKKICASAKKGHYAVLGVAQDASEDDIKRAYRKLALKLHPDKNSAPDAEAAFKAVGLAYGTLSDPEKKAHYDRYGEDDGGSGGGGGGSGGGMYRRRHPDDINPEDIFNMFFGGGHPGMGRPGVYTYRTGNFGGRQQQNGERPGGLMQLLQLAPLILLFLMSFFSYPNGPTESPFSLQRQGIFMNKRQTATRGIRSGITYWVKDNFDRTYARDRFSLASIEQSVQQQFHDELRYECSVQTQTRQRLYNKAQMTRNKANREDLAARANQMELSACEEYRSWFGG